MSDHDSTDGISPALAAETAIYKRAYADYRAAADPKPYALSLSPYPDLTLKIEKGIHHIMIDTMLMEHPQQIANDLNAVVRHYHQLQAWVQVLPNYSDNQRLEIVGEFLETLGSFLLNAPHFLAERFAYSVSHLAHQANLLTKPGTNETALPKERHIGMSAMRKVAKDWTRFAAFDAELRLLAGTDFDDQTDHYRNKLHHRIPARFEVGHTQMISRIHDEDGVSYGIGGGHAPLKFNELLEPLAAQHEQARKVFAAYLDLIAEFSDAIATSAKKPAA